MKILLLSSIPTPYQLDFIKELNLQKEVEAVGYFLYEKEKNRDWEKIVEGQTMVVANFFGKLVDYKKFYNFLKIFLPDVILIGGYSLPLSNLAIFFAKLKKIKIYYWLERPLPCGRFRAVFKEIYIGAKILFVDGILCIGKFSSEYYKKFSKIIYNFPYSMKLDAFYAIKRDSVRTVRFMFSGQLIPRKNILNLVEAFRAIKSDNARLTIAGSGELWEVIKEKSRKDPRISLLGFIEPAMLPSVYSQNDVFVLPSIHDGWALVINEAMASAMPIISTQNVGAVRENVKHIVNGYMCGEDALSIKEALQYYLDNIDKIYIQGQISRAIIKNSTGDVRNAVRLLLGSILTKK